MQNPLKAALLAAVMLLAGVAAGRADDAAPPPDKMPFDTPYGAPIALARALAAVQAAVAEGKRGWPLNIAVVNSGGNLVAFARMDGAQLGSIAVAQHKARASVKFRRATKVFEDALAKGEMRILSLDDVIASRGGIPLVEDGKLIGAIGCSGGISSQDELVCMAGAAAIGQ